jgi:hypothetical protein
VCIVDTNWWLDGAHGWGCGDASLISRVFNQEDEGGTPLP